MKSPLAPAMRRFLAGVGGAIVAGAVGATLVLGIFVLTGVAKSHRDPPDWLAQILVPSLFAVLIGLSSLAGAVVGEWAARRLGRPVARGRVKGAGRAVLAYVAGVATFVVQVGTAACVFGLGVHWDSASMSIAGLCLVLSAPPLALLATRAVLRYGVADATPPAGAGPPPAGAPDPASAGPRLAGGPAAPEDPGLLPAVA